MTLTTLSVIALIILARAGPGLKARWRIRRLTRTGAWRYSRRFDELLRVRDGDVITTHELAYHEWSRIVDEHPGIRQDLNPPATLPERSRTPT